MPTVSARTWCAVTASSATPVVAVLANVDVGSPPVVEKARELIAR
jgi:hypothetical protein